jgi:hypothetical protein
VHLPDERPSAAPHVRVVPEYAHRGTLRDYRAHLGGNRVATHHPAPTARHKGTKRPKLAWPGRSAPRTATSHKRCGYLVMKGSAVRIRASDSLRTRIGTGFRHQSRSTRRPPAVRVATLWATLR